MTFEDNEKYWRQEWRELKAIEHQGNKQLNAVKIINTVLKLPTAIASFSRLGPKVKKLVDEIKGEQDVIDFSKLLCVKSGGKTHFYFGDFKTLASDICYKSLLEEEKKNQYKMFMLLNELRNYKPTNPDKIRERKETLTSAEMLHNSRSNVIKAFENRVFPFKDELEKGGSGYVW